MSTLETHLGGFVDYDKPEPDTIDVLDIARALANTCRFGGHVNRYYSVAEHACLVRRLVIDAGHPELGFAALHHDSHEAYANDVPTPLKLSLGSAGEEYGKVCARLDAAIAKALNVPVALFHAPEVVAADREALFREAGVLKASRGTGDHWGNEEIYPAPPWHIGLVPHRAERLFLAAHAEEIANG